MSIKTFGDILKLFIDLQKSNSKVKSFLLLLVPIIFWYISIYLFHKDFFNSSHLSLKITFCSIFALTAFLFTNSIGKKISNHNKIVVDSPFLRAALGMTIQTTILIVLIFIFYTLRFFKIMDLHFYYFLSAYFLILFILAVLLPSFEVEEKSQINID